MSYQRGSSNNKKQDDGYLLAKIDLTDSAMAEIVRSCKEQMTHEVANHTVSILTKHVAENNKLRIDYEELIKKHNDISKIARNAQKIESDSLECMRKWRSRFFYLFIFCIIISSLFYFGGDDVARYIGQPGCMTFSESKYLYFRSIRYYLLYMKYIVYKFLLMINYLVEKIIWFFKVNLTI